MKTPKQQLFLGNFDLAVESRLNGWAEEDVARRIWQKDGTVWVPDAVEAGQTPELVDRLGWLTLPHEMRKEAAALTAFAAGVCQAGFEHVVLLGMGGSSLAPEVLMKVFGNAPGFPALIVLDSTNPQAVQAVADKIDAARTLFLVSSKSGGTVETLSFFKYFFDAVSRVKENPGENFVAVTDPGSKLEALAAEKSFRRVFSSPPDVGGRYSALTYFGLLPAALIGLDVADFLKRAATMAEACGPDVVAPHNPALVLGAALGEMALAAHDKLTFFASPAIAPFTVWIEQLVAESTGKHNTGILPVADEPLADPGRYSRDRIFVYFRLKDDANAILDKGVEALKLAGHLVAEIFLNDKSDLAQEFFRWELATAAAGSVLSINPFDQPDVELAKINARSLMADYQKTGRLPVDSPALVEEPFEWYSPSFKPETVSAGLADFLGHLSSDTSRYLAIMAYVPPSAQVSAALNALRNRLRQKVKSAVTLGYGPRFLHSTGQLHKGGKNLGAFIQLTHTPAPDVSIPGEPYSFGVLIAAQAMGDYNALQERGRQLVRIHLTGNAADAITALAEKL